MTDCISRCECLQVFHVPEEDGCIVFNAESCECHYLDELSAKVFFMFYERPCSRYDLLVNIANYLNREVTEELSVFVEELIQEFRSLNIVESIKRDVA
ncbi:MAG: hypothetical protein M0R33_06035 [Methylomonas sp.]|nr:hypothetical protein [Methylomonas sp.]